MLLLTRKGRLGLEKPAISMQEFPVEKARVGMFRSAQGGRENARVSKTFQCVQAPVIVAAYAGDLWLRGDFRIGLVSLYGMSAPYGAALSQVGWLRSE